MSLADLFHCLDHDGNKFLSHGEIETNLEAKSSEAATIPQYETAKLKEALFIFYWSYVGKDMDFGTEKEYWNFLRGKTSHGNFKVTEPIERRIRASLFKWRPFINRQR